MVSVVVVQSFSSTAHTPKDSIVYDFDLVLSYCKFLILRHTANTYLSKTYANTQTQSDKNVVLRPEHLKT